MKMGTTNSIAYLICQVLADPGFCNPLFSLEDIAEEMKDIEEEMEAQNPIDSMLLDFDPSVCWLLILITITVFLSYPFCHETMISPPFRELQKMRVMM